MSDNDSSKKALPEVDFSKGIGYFTRILIEDLVKLSNKVKKDG